MKPTAEQPADSAGDLYVKTPVTPEEVFQAIGRLRKDARDEIDRLIRFLDESDNHMELEDSADDSLQEEAEDEPFLGSIAAGERSNQEKWAAGNLDDREGDGCADDREGDELEHGGDEHDGAEPEEPEPSLGSVSAVNQDRWAGRPDCFGYIDAELQEFTTAAPQHRSELGKGVHTTSFGYGQPRLRGLSEAQAARLNEHRA